MRRRRKHRRLPQGIHPSTDRLSCPGLRRPPRFRDRMWILPNDLHTRRELALLARRLAGWLKHHQRLAASPSLLSSLGAQGGLPWSSQRSRTHAATCIKPKHLKPPFHSLSPPPCSSARTGHVSGGVSTHCAALLFPPPSPPHPSTANPPPNLSPKPQESTSLRFFQHFSVASRRAGLLRHHYPLILIDKGEN